MNKKVSSLTNQQPATQEVFWTWINESVRQTVVDLAQKAMELIRDSRLEAGWNQRKRWVKKNRTLADGTIYGRINGQFELL